MLNRPWILVGLLLLAVIASYAIAYLGMSDVYVGRFEGQRITIRLFETGREQAIWKPCLWIEGFLRRSEFHGQVRGGASLPPSVED